MMTKVKPRIRQLYDWEIEQISPIFGDSLHMDKVRVCERYSWPDLANRLGRLARHQPAPGSGEHNAITLGNHCYFPVLLQETMPPKGNWDIANMKWLTHELTHVWQYQHIGIKYLTGALWAQFRFKEAAYDYGGAEGLSACRLEGGTLFSFNPEAQAQIVEDFYELVHYNRVVSAFQPFIDDLQRKI